MKSDKNKDQLDELIASLQNHEEPYTEGAWERFANSQKKKKRIIPIWFYPGLAAGLVAIFSFVFLFNSKNQNYDIKEIPVKDELGQSIPQQEQAPSLHFDDMEESATDHQNIRALADNAIAAKDELKKGGIGIVPQLSKPQSEMHLIAINSEEKTTFQAKLIEGEVFIELAELETRINEALSEISLLSSDTQIKKVALNENVKLELPFDSFDDEKRDSGSEKWAFDVLLSSNVALAGDGSRLNLGAGFVSDYKLNKRLSLTGGISLNQFSADNYNQGRSRRMASDAQPNNPDPGAPGAVFSSVVNTVSSQLLGIEMPIGIKMNISEGLYAQTGISPVGMIRERTESLYTVETFTPSWSNDPSGNPQFSLVRNSFAASANNSYNTFEQVNFAAFYNLSFGYTSKIGSKNRLSFEPYLRLPLGSLNSRESSWSVSGLNLKFGF